MLVDLDGYDVFQCQSDQCRLIWRTPMLGHVRIGNTKYSPRERDKFSAMFYHDTFCTQKGLKPFADPVKWQQDYDVAKARLELIAKVVRPSIVVSLLDVGCSNGAFVAAALDAGYNAFGNDAGEEIIEWAKSHDKRLQKRLVR